MKRIYFKDVECDIFVDVYDNVLYKTDDAYVICCETNEQLNMLYDLFRRVMSDVYTVELGVHIPRKYIRKVVHVSTGSLAQLVK